MKHENFKVFQLANGQMFSGEIDEFIKSGLTLKSLSLTELPPDIGGLLVSIGYTNDKTEDKYQLKVVNLCSVYQLDHIEYELNLCSSEFDGIICQDMAVLNGTDVIATFLVIEQVS